MSEVWVVTNEYSLNNQLPVTRVVGAAASREDGIALVRKDAALLNGTIWSQVVQFDQADEWMEEYTRATGRNIERGDYTVRRYNVEGKAA